MAATAEMVKVTIRVPVDLVRLVKHWAVDHDCDLQDAVRIALERLIARGRRP